MSLLDRVQRKAEGGPAPSPSHTPAAPASPPAQERTLDVENDRYAPAGWQTRQNAATQAPAPTPQPAPAPIPMRPPQAPVRPAETERPSPAAETPRAPSLLNRTGGGLNRPGLSKMGGHTNTHVALRGKVHQRLVEELAQDTNSVPPEVVRQRISEILNDVITEQNMTLSRPDRMRLVEILVNDVLGLGPLEELLANDEV